VKTIPNLYFHFAASAAALLFAGAGTVFAEDDEPGQLPVSKIENIVGVQGSVTKGVLDLGISRTDIGNVQGPLGVVFTSAFVFTPAFEINGDIFFQPLSNGQAFMNGDLALKEEEVKNFISALLKNGLEFQ
jgi:hypothetical protein